MAECQYLSAIFLEKNLPILSSVTQDRSLSHDFEKIYFPLESPVSPRTSQRGETTLGRGEVALRANPGAWENLFYLCGEVQDESARLVFCFTSQVSRRSISSLPTTFRFFHFPDAFFWFPDRFPHGCWKLQIPIPTANANAHPFPSTNACTGNGFFRVHWLCQNRLKWGVWFQTPKEYEVVMNSSLELWNNYVILLIYIFLFLTHYIRLTVRLTFSKSSVKMTNGLETVGAQGL